MFYEEVVVSYSTLVPNMPRRVTLIVYEVYAFNHYGCVYVCQKLLNYRQSRNCVGVTNSGPTRCISDLCAALSTPLMSHDRYSAFVHTQRDITFLRTICRPAIKYQT